MLVRKVCGWCGKEYAVAKRGLTHALENTRFCGDACYDAWIQRNGQHTSMVGARSELIAAAALLRRGWFPFRNLCWTGPVDLIAYKDGVMVPIDVKTGTSGDAKEKIKGVVYLPVRNGFDVDLSFLDEYDAKVSLE